MVRMITTIEAMKQAMIIGNTVAYLDVNIKGSVVIPLTVRESQIVSELSELELYGKEGDRTKVIPVLDHILEKEVSEHRLFLTGGEAFAYFFKLDMKPPVVDESIDDQETEQLIKNMPKDEFIDYLFQGQHDETLSQSVKDMINERAKDIFGEDINQPEFTKRMLMGKINAETKKDGYIIDQRIKNDPDYAASFAAGYIETDQTILKLHQSIDDPSIDEETKELIISAIGAIGKLKTTNKQYESALHHAKEAMRKNLVYAMHKDETVLFNAIKRIEAVLKNNKKDDDI